MREIIRNVRNALKSVICTAIIVYTVILPLSWFWVRKITVKATLLCTRGNCWKTPLSSKLCLLFTLKNKAGYKFIMLVDLTKLYFVSIQRFHCVHFNCSTASINISSFTPFCWTYLSLAIIMLASQRHYFLLVYSCVRLQGSLTLPVNML